MRAISGSLLFLLLCGAIAVQDGGSPVQKVIELLDEMKGKITSDLGAESQAMEEYLQFCSDETKEKGFAVKTSERQIADFSAVIEDSKATITEKEDEVSTLGTVISGKEKELDAATKVREAQNADFVTAEKELVTSVDECARAATALAKGLSLAQIRGTKKIPKRIREEVNALRVAVTTILNAAWIDAGSARKLHSFLQESELSADADDESLSLHQPQAKVVAYESKSGAIVDMVKDMQKKIETELSELRKKEMASAHEFKMLEASLVSEIEHSKEQLASASAAKSGAAEEQSNAEGELAEVTKTKAADVEYMGTLRTDCETKANEWEAREKSAKEEMGALDKAKSILSEGVKAFVQVKSTHRLSFDDEDDKAELREQISRKLEGMGRKFHSYALMSLAAVARSDPFVKIRGMIEEMIASLLKQAEEEATQKAFCDEEMGKSKKSRAIKEGKIDKYAARIDSATSGIAELEGAVKQLEAETAEIDKATAEATAIRTKESADNLKAMKDFKDSADAVISAIGVLKSFYEGGAFIQLSSQVRTRTHMHQPDFGGAKQDAGSSIISVLEVAESDFTRLYAEVETSENEAADAYDKLITENKVSKATKEVEAKAKASEVKSLTVQLSQSKEDHASVSSELDAVLAYMDKLKPQCETKAMSYEEKVAKRNAEIEGLKEALSILSGESIPALLQSEGRLRGINRY